jgi:hypothetical protein
MFRVSLALFGALIAVVMVLVIDRQLAKELAEADWIRPHSKPEAAGRLLALGIFVAAGLIGGPVGASRFGSLLGLTITDGSASRSAIFPGKPSPSYSHTNNSHGFVYAESAP